jgi:hypothetical protein
MFVPPIPLIALLDPPCPLPCNLLPYLPPTQSPLFFFILLLLAAIVVIIRTLSALELHACAAIHAGAFTSHVTRHTSHVIRHSPFTSVYTSLGPSLHRPSSVSALRCSWCFHAPLFPSLPSSPLPALAIPANDDDAGTRSRRP